MPKISCDVLIIGGGLVGLSLAKGLERLNISYRLVDPSLGKAMQLTRALALSKTSLAILAHLGIDFRRLKPSPIQKIQVSCEGAWGKLYFDEPKHDFLGQVVNLAELQLALIQALKDKNSLIAGRFHQYDPKTRHLTLEIEGEVVDIETKLVIAADGAQSPVRQACQLPLEIKAEQSAILAFVDKAQPHHGFAFERFTRLGPMALLPWGLKTYALIWGMGQEQAQEMMTLGPDALAIAIKRQFGSYLLDLESCRFLQTYPLKQVFMPKQHFQSILFLGNAAHTLHPVAGQGFNLSLRDVAVLLDSIQQYGCGAELFPIYLLKREADQRMTQQLTQFLAAGMQQITTQLPQVAGLGLSMAQYCPGVKDWFGFYAQGLGYPLPAWVYEQLEVIYD